MAKRAARWLLLAFLVGCDDGRWREMKPAELGLGVAMPCRPARQDRTAELAGLQRTLSLWSCAHDDWIYAVLRVPVTAPVEVDAAMAALLDFARKRQAQGRPVEVAAVVPGMTPHSLSSDLIVDGSMPGGPPRYWRTVVFRHGLTVYQATVIGAAAVGPSADLFVQSLKVAP